MKDYRQLLLIPITFYSGLQQGFFASDFMQVHTSSETHQTAYNAAWLKIVWNGSNNAHYKKKLLSFYEGASWANKTLQRKKVSYIAVLLIQALLIQKSW